MSQDQKLVKLEQQRARYARKLARWRMVFLFCSLIFAGFGYRAETFVLIIPWAASLLALLQVGIGARRLKAQIRQLEGSGGFYLTDYYPPRPER